MKISELEELIKEVFNDTLVTSVDTVYELSEDGKFNKLVISLHGLDTEDTIIVHTKFIFKTNLEKTELISDDFTYLYDINCIYHLVKFSDIEDLKEKINDIIYSNSFGKDIKSISEFLSSPVSQLNDELLDKNIENMSVYEVRYNPKFKIMPCKLINFDFDININNIYKIGLNISKLDKENYKLKLNLIEDYENIETENLVSIPDKIISGIIKLMSRYI